MHAGDQQAGAAALDQEVGGVGDALRPTGQHDDAVGAARGLRLAALEACDENAEAGQQRHDQRQQQHAAEAQPAATWGRARGRGLRGGNLAHRHRLADAAQRAVDGGARGERRHQRHQHGHAEYAAIAARVDAERPDQRVDRAVEIDPGGQRRAEEEQRHGRAAADRRPLHADGEEMALELADDETVARADEMQHLDHRPRRIHRRAGGDGDAQHGGGGDQRQHAQAYRHRGAGGGGQPLRPLTMVVEAGGGHLLGERRAQGGERLRVGPGTKG